MHEAEAAAGRLCDAASALPRRRSAAVSGAARVRALIVFTAGPRVVEIEAERLDAALAKEVVG